MPIVVNTNAAATQSSFNLSRANDALRSSLSRLSSGNRINSPADDAGGMAVAYKMDSTIKRTESAIQNAQNGLSYLQVQDGALSTVGNILTRMSELRTMAMDVTKNSGDIENYSKEFVELQSQLNQIKESKFNGISLFAHTASTLNGAGNTGTGTYQTNGGGTASYSTFSRTLFTTASGIANDGSISLNVVNLQFVLSVANNVDLGGLSGNTGAAAANADTTTVGSKTFLGDISDFSISVFTTAIEKLADMRAENGAEQNRVMNSIEFLQTNMTNLEAAHGRIMDADIALESTRFARQNVLVQASASMTAQANQLTNIALQLLG
jgi:flagellin